VDTAHFHHAKRSDALRGRLGVREGDTLVLHVGRLAAEKNLDVLAAAWTLAHEQLGRRAVFCIAGEGPHGERLASRMPWALRLGFIERAKLAALYASADVCVLPSRTETCGLVALEAMASGVPVVAARAGGFAESVAHGRSGLLVKPDDVRGFAAAIADLVAQPALRRAMGAQARLAAVGRDRHAEDEELLEQYAALVHAEPEGRWLAAS
jgi:glycosyltransferase involved in cell wall biosynthesis